LWTSVVGDAEGANIDQANKVLCMALDLSSKKSNLLADLSFFKLLNTQQIQSDIINNALSIEDLAKIWKKYCGDLNTKTSQKVYDKLCEKVSILTVVSQIANLLIYIIFLSLLIGKV
jgi:hypothetical protein